MTEENIRVFIIDADESSHRVTKGLLKDIPRVSLVGETMDPSQGYDMVRQAKPAVIILNLYPAVDQVLRLAEKITHNFPHTTLFVTSDDRNPETIIKAMRTGAREFLSQPLQRQDLAAAFSKLRVSSHWMAEGVSDGKIVSVFGAKGGVGTTTVATNLAVTLAEKVKKRVILLDLNLQLGNAALFLNIKSKYSILDLSNNIEDLDPVVLKGALHQHPSGIYLLAGPSRPEQAESISEHHLDRIMSLLRSMFDCVVIDLPHVLNALSLRALDESETILMVLTDDIAAIYNASQLLDVFKRIGYSQDKVKLVLNRGSSNRGISGKEIVKSINYPVFWMLPNQDYPTVLSSLNQGIPISSYKPHSKVSESFRGLALNLNGSPPATGETADKTDGRKSMVSRLFSKK
jgi:pilus assembly protein CpaE